MTEKYFAAQSLDNQILVYSTDNFRQARNKRFAGHSVAGYACQVGFSPDGKWISSGDGEGNVVFWEWKTGRIKSRLKAHSKVVIAHEWLPHETVSCCRSRLRGVALTEPIVQSKVVTASWDGLIKLWVWIPLFRRVPRSADACDAPRIEHARLGTAEASRGVDAPLLVSRHVP